LHLPRQTHKQTSKRPQQDVLQRLHRPKRRRQRPTTGTHAQRRTDRQTDTHTRTLAPCTLQRSRRRRQPARPPALQRTPICLSRTLPHSSRSWSTLAFNALFSAARRASAAFAADVAAADASVAARASSCGKVAHALSARGSGGLLFCRKRSARFGLCSGAPRRLR
jgi:hypothetical protein